MFCVLDIAICISSLLLNIDKYYQRQGENDVN